MFLGTKKPCHNPGDVLVEEYLRTSFEDADCEFLDGEIYSSSSGRLTVGLGPRVSLVRA